MTHKTSISQKNDASSINNRRGMAKRAKRNSSKKSRKVAKEVVVNNIEEIEAWCPDCGAPHLVRPGKTQPTCICADICDRCGGRIVYHVLGEDPLYENMGGYWCSECGPFGGLNARA
jgi:DNA-directed RNA polymerase subunit RPC12/RpoP